MRNLNDPPDGTQVGRIYAGYRRVSDVGGRDEKLRSPTFQAELIEGKARVDGLAVRMYPAELDVSGGKAARAVLDEILGGIEAGELAGIIVAKLDRLSRLPARERVELVARIEDAGGVILSASEDCDPRTPEGRFTRDLFFGIARMQWEKYRDGFELARRTAVADGVKIARTANSGYRFDANHRLEPVAKNAAAVKEMFQLAGSDGNSLAACADLLHERTGRHFDPRHVRDMLRNPVYLGHVIVGDLVKLAAHEAIVTEAEFKAAQRPVAGAAPLRRSGVKSLLAGIARCGTCGRKMGSTTAGGVSKGTRVYRCPKRGGAQEPCKAPATINEELLDAYVEDAVKAWAHAERVDDVVIEVREPDRIADAAEQLAAAERDRDEYAVATAGAGIPADTVAAGLRARQELVDAAQAALDALRAADTAGALRVSVRELWPTLTRPERRQLIASVVDRVTVNRAAFHREPVDGRATIKWRQ